MSRKKNRKGRTGRATGKKSTIKAKPKPKPEPEPDTKIKTGPKPERQTELRVTGLFAGVGGLEQGLAKAGHHTHALCEIDPSARAVLQKRFTAVDHVYEDVRKMRSVPPGTDLLTAGFPCQDLSQAGRTAGIKGKSSGLIDEVFRLLGGPRSKNRVPNLLLENVPFLLRLDRGAGLAMILDELERRGYQWAYRIVDSRAFGVLQRRERVFLLASRDMDPATVLLADDTAPAPLPLPDESRAFGFYWTEGNTGLGAAVGIIPPLKSGSTVGIPSAPAIILPDKRIVTPGIRDAEALQGFRRGWTKPAESVARASYRWRLVGNAVTVPAAAWIGKRIAKPGSLGEHRVTPIKPGKPWPDAAYGKKGARFAVHVSRWPKRKEARRSLPEFLEDPQPLSLKATRGFYTRLQASSLRRPDWVDRALARHIQQLEKAAK